MFYLLYFLELKVMTVVEVAIILTGGRTRDITDKATKIFSVPKSTRKN